MSWLGFVRTVRKILEFRKSSKATSLPANEGRPYAIQLICSYLWNSQLC